MRLRLPTVEHDHWLRRLPLWLLPYGVIILAIVALIAPIYAPGQLVFSDLDFGASSAHYLDEIYGLWNRRWSTPNLFNVPRLLYTTPFVGLAALFGHDGAVLLKALLTAILLVAGISYYSFATGLFHCYFGQRKSAFTTSLLTFSALFYALNPWVIFRIQHIFLLCGYALFPLVIYAYLRLFDPAFDRARGAHANRFLPDLSTFADLLLFCSAFTLSAAALHYLLFMPLVLLALQSFILVREVGVRYAQRVALRPYLLTTLRRGLWVMLLLTLFSFYWLVTYVGSIWVGARPDQFNINTADTIQMFSQNSSWSYVALGISYWWPMFDLNALPLSFFIGGGLLLGLAVLALLRVRWGTLLLVGAAGVLVVLATGTYYPPLAESYLALIFRSFFPINNLLRDPNKLLALYLLILPLLMTLGAQNVVARFRQRWQPRVGSFVVAAMLLSYGAYLAPFHATFFHGFYAPIPVPAAYQEAGAFLTAHLQPTERAIYLPLASSMLNRATGVTAPFWNRIDSAGHVTERATGDFQIYDSPVATLYPYEGNPPTIAQYYTYVQSLLDQGRTSHLAELLNPLGGRFLAYRTEYPIHDQRQQLNRGLLALQPGLTAQFTNTIFTIYANDQAAPLTRVVPQVIFTPYGYGHFERYAAFPAFSFSHLGALFTTTALDKPIAAMLRPQDYLEVAQADDLRLSMLPAANYIVPFDQVNEGNPFLQWSKTFLGSEEWLWYMQHYQIANYPFDFDFGRGVLFTTASGRLDVPVYRIHEVKGKPLLQLSALNDLTDFFVADNPDTLRLSSPRTSRVDELPLLQGRVQDGPYPYLWQVARSRLVPIQPSHPYRLSAVVAGINSAALHLKVKFFDEQLQELGAAYLARSAEAATFDATQLTTELMTPAGAALMEINILSRQDPAVTAVWQLHQLTMEDLAAYRRDNRVTFTYPVTQTTTTTLYARLFFNRAGGKLRVEVGGQAVEIATKDADLNQFRWVTLGVFTLPPGVNNLAVTNLSGFNALNLLASVPQTQQALLANQMATLVRASRVFLTLDAEEDFRYQGHRQPTQAYPLLTSGHAIRSQDGQITAEFDIVKQARYTLLVRHSDLPVHGALAVTMTNLSTQTPVLQHRIVRRPEQPRTSQVTIAAVHEDRLGQRYLTTENDPLLANMTQTELPGLDLPPGRYRLTITFDSNAPALAATADLSPASAHEQITVTYKAPTLWANYTVKTPPAQRNGVAQADVLPCTEVELAPGGDAALREAAPTIVGAPAQWQTLTTAALPVVPHTPYLFALALRSVNLADLHVKLTFFDQAQRALCAEYMADRLAGARQFRFSDDARQQHYIGTLAAAAAEWQQLEKVVNAPANARTMRFQIIAQVDAAKRSSTAGGVLGLAQGQLAVKDFHILAFRDLAAVDLTALYEATATPFLAAVAPPAAVDAVDLDSMTTQITLPTTAPTAALAKAPTTIALRFGEAPSNLWRLYTPAGVFKPWPMDGTQSAFFFPPTPTATAKIILADAYRLGLLLLVGGLLASALFSIVMGRTRLRAWLAKQQPLLYPFLDVPLSALNYAFLVFASWHLPRGAYGIANSLLALLALTLMIGLALQTLTAQRVSASATAADTSALLRVGGLAGGLVGLLFLLTLPLLQALTHGSVAALLALYLAFVCNIFVSIFRGRDQGQKRFLRLNLSFYIEVFGKTTALLLGLTWFPTITTVIGAVLVGMALSLAYSLVAEWQAKPTAHGATTPQPIGPLLRQLRALVAAQFLLQFLVTTDLILINYYSPYNAGAYAVVAKYGQLILFSFLSLQTVLFPMLNRAAATRTAFQPLLRTVMLGYLGLSLLVIIAYHTLIPSTIPRFFGPAYADTGALLTLGAGVYCLLAFIHLLVNLFIIKQDARYLGGLAAAAVLSLGLTLAYAQNIHALLIAQLALYTALSLVLCWLGSPHWRNA